MTVNIDFDLVKLQPPDDQRHRDRPERRARGHRPGGQVYCPQLRRRDGRLGRADRDRTRHLVRPRGVLGRGKLFYALSDGTSTARTFDGTTFGARPCRHRGHPVGTAPTPAAEHLRQQFLSVELPASPACSTSTAGSTTRRRQPSLFWRWFSPDSGIVGSVRFSARPVQLLSNPRHVLHRPLDLRGALVDR